MQPVVNRVGQPRANRFGEKGERPISGAGGMTDNVQSPDRFGLIVGAMKCGTTSLFNHLAGHPEVAPCRTKEPNYFSGGDFNVGDPHAYFALWDWDPSRHKIAIEASNGYAKMPAFPNCADRIAQYSQLDFRFVYSMRNPIDRIESHIDHGAFEGWAGSLDAAGITEHTVAVSRYAMQLGAYAKRFGRDKIQLIVLEDFKTAPAKTFRDLCVFLGIDPEIPLADHKKHNRAADHFIEHPIWGWIRSIETLRRMSRAIPAVLRAAIRRSTGSRSEARRKLTPRREVADRGCAARRSGAPQVRI
jgi:hypothetical protein